MFAGQIITSLAPTFLIDDGRASMLPFGSFAIGVHVSGPKEASLLVDELTVALAAGNPLMVAPPEYLDQANSKVTIFVGVKRVPEIAIRTEGIAAGDSRDVRSH